MKALILAISLLLLPMSASAQMSDEQCFKVSTMIFFAATGRDMGSPPQAVIDGLVSNGLTLDNAVRIGNLIFINMPERSPDFLATTFFNFCTSEAT